MKINHISKAAVVLFKWIITLMFMHFLSACSSIPTTNSVNRVLPDTAAELSNWIARGKIMFASGKEKNSGYFYWHQQNDNYRFSVNSFIGTNVFTLNYQNGIAVIEADGNTYKSDNADELITDLLGQSLPISNFKFWLLGEATPNILEAKFTAGQLAQFNYLTEIEQNWLITYNSRQQIDHFNLPKSIYLKSNSNKVKLSISNWELQN